MEARRKLIFGIPRGAPNFFRAEVRVVSISQTMRDARAHESLSRAFWLPLPLGESWGEGALKRHQLRRLMCWQLCHARSNAKFSNVTTRPRPLSSQPPFSAQPHPADRHLILLPTTHSQPSSAPPSPTPKTPTFPPFFAHFCRFSRLLPRRSPREFDCSIPDPW